MKKAIAGAALVQIVAAPAVALGPGKPIACVYDHVAHNNKIDHDALMALVGRNMKVASSDDKMVMQRIGGEMGKCQSQYGWSQKHQQAAFAYMRARLLYDSDEDALKPHGIKYEMMHDVVGGMTPQLRQTYLGGTVTGEMIGAVVTSLKAAGATIDDASAGDRTFEIALDKAVVAAIAEDDAEQSFAAR